MKKIKKLLTIIPAAAVIATAAPIVTTSCSNDSKPTPTPEPIPATGNYMTYNGQNIELESPLDPNSLAWKGGNSLSIIKKDGSKLTLNQDEAKKVTAIMIREGDQFITTVNDGFLKGFSAMTDLDLSGLNYVQKIGTEFLGNCSALVKLDMRKMTSLSKDSESLGMYFFNNCKALKELIVPNSVPPMINQNWGLNLDSLQVINCNTAEHFAQYRDYNNPNNHWAAKISSGLGENVIGSMTTAYRLADNTSLNEFCVKPSIKEFALRLYDGTSLTLQRSEVVGLALQSVPSYAVGDYFMAGCENLEEIYTPSWTNVRYIGDYFLGDCKKLSYFDFIDLMNVQTIGDFFLYGCEGLASLINFNALTSVSQVGSYFMSGCKLITTLNFAPQMGSTIRLAHIGDYFLKDCTGLSSLDMQDLINLSQIGDNFLDGCTDLITLKVPLRQPPTLMTWGSNLNKLTSIVCGNEVSNYLNAYLQAPEWKEKITVQSTSNNIILNNGVVNVTDQLDDVSGMCNDSTTISVKGASGDLVTINKSDIVSVSIKNTKTDLTTIPDQFLMNCSNLKNIDLSGFKSVTTIGANFLEGCYSITEIDLSKMDAMWSSTVTGTKAIKKNFLFGCDSLQKVNFGQIVKGVFTDYTGHVANDDIYAIATISKNSPAFVNGVKIAGTDATNIKQWLVDTTSATYPYKNPTAAVNKLTVSSNDIILADNFDLNDLCWAVDTQGNPTSMTIHKQDGSTQTINYTDAANITALQLDTVDTSVTEIKNNFLRGCTGLSGKLDLSFLSNITKIDDHFLQGCSTINELDLTPLANVKTIGNYFLNDCTALATVNFNVLSNLTSIGGYFLSGCTTLPASLSFSNLNKVTKIGERFLQNCTTLTSVDLSGFVNVTEIGYYFLRGCTSLLNIDMSNMISLGKVDEGFLWGIGSNDPVRRIQSLILPQRAVWNLVSWGNTNTGSTDDEVKAELAKLFGDAGESAAKLIHCGGYLKQYKTYENNRMWKLARDYMTE